MERRSCGTCSYHKLQSVTDSRGYTVAEMCTCKESKRYKEFTDNKYHCPCYKQNRYFRKKVG